MVGISAGIALSGAMASQRQLDLIGHNLANQQTPGFKRSHAFTTDIGYGEGLPSQHRPDGTGVAVGEGVQVAETRHEFLPGAVQPTGNPLDVALTGDGFLVVGLPDGGAAYTRDGALHVDAAGRLVTSGGLPFQGDGSAELVVPQDTASIRVDGDGQVFVTSADGAEGAIGRLAVVQFRNNLGLLASGQNLLSASPASGAPQAVAAGGGAGPVLVGGALEASNVDVADEFARLIQAQRSYQMNLHLVEDWDEIARLASEVQRA